MRFLARMLSTAAATLLAACASVVATGCGGSEAREPEPKARLALELSLPEGPFAAGDSVPLKIALRNVGDVPAHVNARFLVNEEVSLHDVWVKMLGPDGRRLPMSVRVDPDAEEVLGSKQWKVLQPGESVATTYDLARYYDLGKTGFYAVQAIYENAEDAPKSAGDGPAWKGRLGSNVLRFRRS